MEDGTDQRGTRVPLWIGRLTNTLEAKPLTLPAVTDRMGLAADLSAAPLIRKFLLAAMPAAPDNPERSIAGWRIAVLRHRCWKAWQAS